MARDCVCPDGKCNLGRQKGKEKDPLCPKCIDLWFQRHLPHRIQKMLEPEGSESKCIAMRSLLQFLGLSAKPNPITKKFELEPVNKYWFSRILSQMRGSPEVTYEVRATNLGGKTFDSTALSEYKAKHPEKAELLARFLYGVHVHTAHLTWGANHAHDGAIWDINEDAKNTKVVRLTCELLQERLYEPCKRKAPWAKRLGSMERDERNCS